MYLIINTKSENKTLIIWLKKIDNFIFRTVIHHSIEMIVSNCKRTINYNADVKIICLHSINSVESLDEQHFGPNSKHVKMNAWLNNNGMFREKAITMFKSKIKAHFERKTTIRQNNNVAIHISKGSARIVRCSGIRFIRKRITQRNKWKRTWATVPLDEIRHQRMTSFQYEACLELRFVQKLGVHMALFPFSLAQPKRAATSLVLLNHTHCGKLFGINANDTFHVEYCTCWLWHHSFRIFVRATFVRLQRK